MWDPWKWLASFIPRDPDNTAGFGPFRLPSPECDWMQRAATLHDDFFDNGPQEHLRLSQGDWDLFYRWVLEANSCDDPIERCHRAEDICEFWPLARKVGHYLYSR